MADYGPNVLKDGDSFADLHGIRLWMVYLHHRWSIDSAVRYIGGMFENLTVKGESIPPTEIVPAAKQREILSLLLDDVTPENLAIPERIIANLGAGGGEGGPRQSNLENLTGSTGYAFDQLAAARTVAGLVFDQLFEADKAARLVSFADRQPGALTLPETIDACVKKVFDGPAVQGANKSLQRQTQRVLVEALMTLGASPAAPPDVKAVVMASLASLRTEVAGMKDADPVTEAHLRQMDRDLMRYTQNPTAPRKSAPAPPIMAPI